MPVLWTWNPSRMGASLPDWANAVQPGNEATADRAGKRPSTFQRRPPGQGRRGAVAYPFAVIRAFLH